MLRRIETKNFKVFEDETFDISQHLMVVGPNNGGKTSLLQAIATWAEIANHWFETNADFARLDDGNYAASDLNILRFNAVPLLDFPHLWSNKAVTTPVFLGMQGDNWRVGFEIVYSATELAAVRPTQGVTETHLERCRENLPTIVYIPPVWRLVVREDPLTKDGVRAKLRRGQMAEVLRNVLRFIAEDEAKWKRLQEAIRSFFGYELLAPSSGAYVIANYRHRAGDREYDLSSAASGFLQVLAVYAGLLFDNAAVILVDEPDAHLHFFLQEKIYRDLQRFAMATNSQLLMATHSEVLIKTAKLEHLRLLWRGFRAMPTNKQVNEVMRLDNSKLVLAETALCVLYVEGESDLHNMREWARVLSHPAFEFLDKPFWEATASGSGRDFAGKNFGAMRRLVPKLKAVEICDGDKKLPKKTPAGLFRLQWTRTEIENYLIHPTGLERFVREAKGEDAAQRVVDYMRKELPVRVFEAPFEPPLIAEVKGSTMLGHILQEAGLQLEKTDYWRIAAQMRPEEIHPEVREKLDAIAAHCMPP